MAVQMQAQAVRYPLFDSESQGKCYRVEYQGEVTYWYEDGTNDVMKGEKGSLAEAITALVRFAHYGYEE